MKEKINVPYEVKLWITDVVATMEEIVKYSGCYKKEEIKNLLSEFQKLKEKYNNENNINN